MTSTQVVKMSVNVISNSPSQDYTHPDDRTLLNDMTPGFKPFTILTNERTRILAVILKRPFYSSALSQKAFE